MTTYLHMSYFDASAAVKLVVPERGSDAVLSYLDYGGLHITAICLSEALGVLKRRMLRGDLSEDDYFHRCYALVAFLRAGHIHIEDFQITDFDVFSRAEELARRYHLDLSDSLQLVTVKHGRFRKFAEESKTVLVTADRASASAARNEGLRVWNCEEEAQPPAK